MPSCFPVLLQLSEILIKASEGNHPQLTLSRIAYSIESSGCCAAPDPGFMEVVMVAQYRQQLELVVSALTNDIEDQ